MIKVESDVFIICPWRFPFPSFLTPPPTLDLPFPIWK